MDYHEAADFLFDLRRFAVRPGTESTAALRAELVEPGADLPFVQIAGSNGKGSTAKLTESIRRESAGGSSRRPACRWWLDHGRVRR